MNNTFQPATPFLCPLRISVAMLLGVLTIGAASGALPDSSETDGVAMSPVVRGASALTRLRPRELVLSSARPAGVRKVPTGITAPYYTVLDLGSKEKPTRFVFLVDAPEGKPSRLFVDSNGNGDLTDDPPAEWAHKTYEGRESKHLILSVGGATLQVPYGKKIVPMHVTLSRYDTTEPARLPLFSPIYCTADYARDGIVKLSGKQFHVWFIDALTRGDFRGAGTPGKSGIFLLIDVNGNGKIDERGEAYDATAPFNIGGTTYEIRNLTALGDALEATRSSRTVAEVLPPPDLSVGKKVPEFRMTATNGRLVSFPEDYKHKVALLYFWATWCGDCGRETPIVVSAYKKYHSDGLEILGISLDHPNQAQELESYTRAHDMDWPQVYDGKVWDAAIAQQYYVLHTPTALLVDGDTGKILASGSDLLGDRLEATIGKFLTSK